jgi:hypothetical protein
VPERPFKRKSNLTTHVTTGRFYCEGDRPGGCGDAACPRRAAAVPERPFKRKRDLTTHVTTGRRRRLPRLAAGPVQ